MEPTRSILLAEEDTAMRTFLRDNLSADGYHVHSVEDRASALATLEQQQPDLVICDVNGDTLGLLDAIRQSAGVAACLDPDVPLIVLTSRAEELARVRYLDRGCDDVISKPFSYAELRARVRAVLRRTRPGNGRTVTLVGALRIDHHARDVRVGDTAVRLSAKEYALLVHLATEPERVFTKHELLRDVWGFRCPGRTRTVDTHACNLRNKLAGAGDARFVENLWGVGYCLVRAADVRNEAA
jgi:DNA-binding response OmpR family regulator